MPRASEAQRRSFRYQPRGKESVRERANMRGGDFDSIIKPKIKVYKMRDGKNVIRILPPTWEDAKHYGLDVYINYNIGVDNQSYLSLSKMKGEKDPLAEAKREAERGGDKKLSKDLTPRQRIGFFIIDRQDEDEGPQFMLCPFSLDKAIANLSFDEDTKEVIFIDDPVNGCDVRFFKEGSGLNTDYPGEKIKILKSSPLHEDEAVENDWLDFVQENPVPECLQYYDYDHIATVFDGQAGRPETDDEAEARPSRRAPQPQTEPEAPVRRRPAVAADDEEPPLETTSSRRARAPQPEPDEDEQPDEDGVLPEKRFAKAETPKTSIRDRLASRRDRIQSEDE